MTKLKYLLIALVIGISAFTHLYRIDKTYIFNNDEGRDALIAYRMIDTRQPVLLGPETSVGNMYLGPFYYYMMVPSMLISGLDPAGPAIMVGLLGIITTALLIYLGKRKSGYIAGIAAGLFYALSPVMVHYSRSSWNPNVIPFFIALLLLIYPTKKLWHSLSFGLITGIIFQLHYVALIVPALLLLRDIWIGIQSRTWKTLSIQVGMIALGFTISSLPFWLFEIRHAFVNTQAFMTYLVEKGGVNNFGYPPYFTRLINNFKLLVTGLIGSSSLISTKVSLLTMVAGALTLIIYAFSLRGVLTFLTLASIVAISVLKENINIHYLAFLFPIIPLVIGQAVAKKGVLRITTILLLLSLIAPSYSSLKYNLDEVISSQPRRAKETASYINKEAVGRPYNVVNTQGSYATTIMYYLAISDNPPKNDLQPLIFDVCERALCPQDDETTTLLFLTGPAHPAIATYLGHPQINEYSGSRKIIKNEWVTYDIYVATIELKP